MIMDVSYSLMSSDTRNMLNDLCFIGERQSRNINQLANGLIGIGAVGLLGTILIPSLQDRLGSNAVFGLQRTFIIAIALGVLLKVHNCQVRPNQNNQINNDAFV